MQKYFTTRVLTAVTVTIIAMILESTRFRSNEIPLEGYIIAPKPLQTIETWELKNLTKPNKWCEMRLLWWLIEQEHWIDNFTLSTPIALQAL